MRRSILMLAVAAALLAAPAAHAAPVKLCNVPIPMSDGKIMRANVFLPAAGHRYPLSLTVTGYNKDVGNPTGSNCSTSAGLAAANAKLLDAGYAIMIMDDRGTGQSQGTWDSWGQRTQDDYGEVLDWIQRQPWSDGDVGTTGSSYMGITSLLVAEKDAERVAHGKRRAVKAIWANVPMADAYRDVTYHGGSVDSGFIPLWLGLTSGLSDIPPSTIGSDPGDAIPTYAQHLANTFGFAGNKVVDASLGGDSTYDGPFYQLRSPVTRIKKLKIPVAWTGGWWDIFQRGEPLLYEQMTSSKHRTFWMTPHYHASGDGGAFDAQHIGSIDDVQVRWFDRWIKGKHNGIDKQRPVNLFTMGVNRWRHGSSWPLRGTRYTRFYLTGGKGLAAHPSGRGGDTAPLLPASSPCSRLTSQWTAGLVTGTSCETDNRTFETTALTYTTKPLSRGVEVTGLITADLWAKLTSKDASLVAVLSDVAPSGESTQVTAGFLTASHRALDRKQSTRTKGGLIIRPWHPFTRAAQKNVTPGQANRYLIEIYPTSNVFRTGHRIRLTIGTANTPTTLTPTPEQLNETGGSIQLLREPGHRSNLMLPVIENSPLAGGGSCLARRSSIGPRNIGRVRLGSTRRRLLRISVKPHSRTRRTYRYCVKRSRGRVVAVFSSRSSKAKARLVTTTAAGHGNRGVKVGSRASRFRRAYRNRVRLAKGIYRARRGSPRLFGIRRGKVRFIAVADKKLAKKPRTLRRYLRLAGL
ncbi:MAG TPA: CocE/NonD family hydrolase [Thermoleophilaceae bacterium]